MYFLKEMRRCWQFSLNAFLVKLSKYKYEYKMNKNENNISAWIQGKVHLLTIDTTRVVLPYTSGKRWRSRLFDSEIWRSFPYNNWHCEGAKSKRESVAQVSNVSHRLPALFGTQPYCWKCPRKDDYVGFYLLY